MTEQPYTLVAADSAALRDLAPVSAERFQIKRVLQAAGITVIRLSFAQGQIMREHSTTAPLVVQILEGQIVFRIAGDELEMHAGAVLYVEPNERHELEARSDAHVLLTLSV